MYNNIVYILCNIGEARLSLSFFKTESKRDEFKDLQTLIEECKSDVHRRNNYIYLCEKIIAKMKGLRIVHLKEK